MSYFQNSSCKMQGYGFGEIPPHYYEMPDVYPCNLEIDTRPYVYDPFYRMPPYPDFFSGLWNQRDETYHISDMATPSSSCTPTPSFTPPAEFCEPTLSRDTTSNPTIQTNWDNCETGRRNLSRLLKCDYKFKHSKYLIFFTYSVLSDKNNKDIVWRDETAGRFFIKNPKGFAQAWGRYKNNAKMNYGNVARSLRYYYTTGLLKKSDGLREYTWDQDVLASLREKFKSSAPLVRREQACSSSN